VCKAPIFFFTVAATPRRCSLAGCSAALKALAPQQLQLQLRLPLLLQTLPPALPPWLLQWLRPWLLRWLLPWQWLLLRLRLPLPSLPLPQPLPSLLLLLLSGLLLPPDPPLPLPLLRLQTLPWPRSPLQLLQRARPLPPAYSPPPYLLAQSPALLRQMTHAPLPPLLQLLPLPSLSQPLL
jgi:hypothetical protein